MYKCLYNIKIRDNYITNKNYETMAAAVVESNELGSECLAPPENKDLISTPTQNDILLGRGGLVNKHEGNIRFRNFVKEKKAEYLAHTTKKIAKAQIAAEIVEKIKALNPPGRFLEFDKESGSWSEIDDHKAKKKTGQALREGSTKYRTNEVPPQGFYPPYPPYPPYYPPYPPPTVDSYSRYPPYQNYPNYPPYLHYQHYPPPYPPHYPPWPHVPPPQMPEQNGHDQNRNEGTRASQLVFQSDKNLLPTPHDPKGLNYSSSSPYTSNENTADNNHSVNAEKSEIPPSSSNFSSIPTKIDEDQINIHTTTNGTVITDTLPEQYESDDSAEHDQHVPWRHDMANYMRDPQTMHYYQQFSSSQQTMQMGGADYNEWNNTTNNEKWIHQHKNKVDDTMDSANMQHNEKKVLQVSESTRTKRVPSMVHENIPTSSENQTEWRQKLESWQKLKKQLLAETKNTNSDTVGAPAPSVYSFDDFSLQSNNTFSVNEDEMMSFVDESLMSMSSDDASLRNRNRNLSRRNAMMKMSGKKNKIPSASSRSLFSESDGSRTSLTKHISINASTR